MPLRVKNISEGFVDAKGLFHPIRSASDYDVRAAGEKHVYAPGGRKKSKAKKTVTVPHVRRASKKTAAQIRAALKAKGRKRNPEYTYYLVHYTPQASVSFVLPGSGSNEKAKAEAIRQAPRDATKAMIYPRGGSKGFSIKLKTKNPIPTDKWLPVKVRRTASGDVKIMIPIKR